MPGPPCPLSSSRRAFFWFFADLPVLRPRAR
jgi:hypothetical protein